jgi:hypothetical protein
MEGASDSDADLCAVLHMVDVAEPALEVDSDADVAMVADLVDDMDRNTEVYRQRGHLLMKMLRGRKELWRKARAGHVAPHVLRQLQIHNEDFAKTAENLIDITEMRPQKTQGHGSWKRWIVPALQRACWGLRPRPRVPKQLRKVLRRFRGKQVVQHLAAPTVASTRSFAVFSRSSASHVQAVGDACAEAFCRAQAEKLASLRRADHILLMLALDETEQPCTLEAHGGNVNLILSWSGKC